MIDDAFERTPAAARGLNLMVTTVEKSVPVVQLAGVCKTFRDFWRRPRVPAVVDLTLEVRPGEVFGLLGPNGSGKSTTIKMLLGLLYPSKGRIAIFGRAPSDVAIKNRIGFLPEESYLYRFLDARETLDYFGRLFRLPPLVRRKRTDMLLEMVGLKHEARRPIGEYSKGMARRIGLAQALINDPEFLILDEPTSGLDPLGTRQIKDLIRELGRHGKTILLSSHMLADVEDVCDRVTILYGGRQRAAGHLAELLSVRDKTQIITDQLSRQTIESIRDLVLRLEHKDVLDVSSPRTSLEEFFISIVEDARRANVATSGAAGAGALAEFLGGGKAGDVIRRLESAADTSINSAAVAATPVRAPDEGPSKQVLEQLSRPRSEPTPASVAPSSDAPATTAAPIEADADVLRQLMGDRTSPKREASS
ncbi:MAG: Vitamin B12 import ATP-binding protein BtuD [Phycisphaerae bacterium]|nr:Vitamin B12 import ATP-binding protein BtuD [Phycisphaerae bacterium]